MTLAGMSVLLAEDNPTNQMVASHMLETLGAEVAIATDGVEALDLLSERGFDVALIDIEMPRISGLDLIRQLRGFAGPVAAMPMIALTAYVMREHRAAIEEAGADGIIAKPIVSIQRFGEEIMGHVRQRQARTRTAAPGAAETVRFEHATFDRLRASFDPVSQRELVSRIGKDIGDACEAIARSVRSRDWAALRTATHPLISVAGVIGAVHLQSLAARLNSAGHEQDDTGLDDDGSELLIEAERVLRLVCGGHEVAV